MKKIISVILIILLTKSSFSQQVYTFNGNGKWSDSTNWQDKKMPPIVLDSGSQILIDPIANGECLLDTLQLLRRGSIITIQSGKKLNMSENLVVNPEQKGLGCGLSDLDSLLSVPVLDTSLLPRLSHKMPSALSLPLLDVNLPPVIFQGTQGSCTAFAVAYATRSYYLHQDHCTLYSKNGSKDLSKILSPAFCYNTGKVSASCNADLPLFTALSKMQTSGVCTWERMPYYDYDCSMLPDEATKKNASIYKIDGFNKIKDISQNYIKRTLNGGKLIMAAISVDEGFYNYGKYIWKSQIGNILPNGGGHAIVICGYDDNKHAYEIMNSWGTDWGFKGFGWIDYDYLQKVVRFPDGGFAVGDKGDWEMYTMNTSPRFAVDFKFDPAAIVTGNPVTFRDFTEPEPTTREWSFPEGNLISSENGLQKVIYNTPGTYHVILKVTPCSDYRKSASKDSQIIVHSLPSLTTTDVSPITTTTAISGGNVTDDGGLPITVRGLCWSTSPNPVIDNNTKITSVGIGAGSFASSIGNLTPNTTYYVRAYATNAGGTGYGNPITFTTFQTSIIKTGIWSVTFDDGRTGAGNISLNLVVNNGNITGTVESATGMEVGIGTVTGSTNGTQMSLTIYIDDNHQLCVLYPDGHYRERFTYTLTTKGTTDSNLSFYNATVQFHETTQQGTNDPCTPGPIFTYDGTGTFTW